MDLVGMYIAVKYSFGRVYGVGYDNYLADVIDGAHLVDPASDSKEFSFRTCDKESVMNYFDNRSVKQMDMRYGGSDIILDTCVSNNESCMMFGRATKSTKLKVK